MADRVKITHPERVLWPKERITKQQLIDHYTRFGPFIVKELKGRLLTLVRAPSGIDGEVFFQKNAPGYTPDWIERMEVYAPSAKRDVAFLVVDSVDALRWIGNQSGIELHPTLDRKDRPGKPDLLVFDLDPLDGRFPMAAQAAVVIRELLQGQGLEPLLKTTGGKGLHVYVRLERRYSFEETHDFAVNIARMAIEREPSLMTLEFKKVDRSGRVFVDVHRNGPGATLVCAFSARARPAAPVSFPIGWHELHEIDPTGFTVETVAELVDSDRVQEWEAALGHKQRLSLRPVGR